MGLGLQRSQLWLGATALPNVSSCAFPTAWGLEQLSGTVVM